MPTHTEQIEEQLAALNPDGVAEPPKDSRLTGNLTLPSTPVVPPPPERPFAMPPKQPPAFTLEQRVADLERRMNAGEGVRSDAH